MKLIFIPNGTTYLAIFHTSAIHTAAEAAIFRHLQNKEALIIQNNDHNCPKLLSSLSD